MTFTEYFYSNSFQTMFNLWVNDFAAKYQWNKDSVKRLHSEYMKLTYIDKKIEEIKQGQNTGWDKYYIEKYSRLATLKNSKEFITDFLQSVNNYECISPIFEPQRFFYGTIEKSLSNKTAGEKLEIAWDRTQGIVKNVITDTVDFVTSAAGEGLGNIIKPLLPVIIIAIIIYLFLRFNK